MLREDLRDPSWSLCFKLLGAVSNSFQQASTTAAVFVPPESHRSLSCRQLNKPYAIRPTTETITATATVKPEIIAAPRQPSCLAKTAIVAMHGT
jgi:hypothetical protein